jgi:hypothetical protein
MCERPSRPPCPINEALARFLKHVDTLLGMPLQFGAGARSSRPGTVCRAVMTATAVPRFSLQGRQV